MQLQMITNVEITKINVELSDFDPLRGFRFILNIATDQRMSKPLVRRLLKGTQLLQVTKDAIINHITAHKDKIEGYQVRATSKPSTHFNGIMYYCDGSKKIVAYYYVIDSRFTIQDILDDVQASISHI